MNKKILLWFKIILIIVGLTFINCILLVLSFKLPTGIMRQHVAESYPLIEAEHPYLQWDQGYTSSMVDFWSEYTEYGMAINEDSDGNAFEQALLMRYIDTNGLARDVSVMQYARNPGEYFELGEYPRYWHGIVMIMKILLLFFTIPDIRMINMFLQVFLLSLVIYMMIKRSLSNYIIFLLTAILFINPITMTMSVIFSAEYVPMLLSIIIMLAWGDAIEKINGGWIYYFTFWGTVTSFFCELSFPAITLGIPLLVLIWCKEEKSVTRTVIGNSVAWGVAYAITWVMKWIICTLFTSYNLFESVFDQVQYYEVEQSTDASVYERIMKNIWAYRNPAFMVLVVIVAIVVIAIAVRGKMGVQKNTSVIRNYGDIILGYIIVMLIPFIMYIVLGNGYSFVHAFMTHRQLAISAASGMCILSVITEMIITKIGKRRVE